MKKKDDLFVKKIWFRISFIILGLGSLIWFLIRVIPKPTRATYPCMRAAAPLASSFVAYIIGLGTFALFMKKARERIKNSKYLVATIFIIIGLTGGVISLFNYAQNTKLKAQPLQGLQIANDPMGEGVGIKPGRVAWIHNPDAVDEKCPNSDGDYWYMDINTDQDIVDKMLSDGLQCITGTKSDVAAWDTLFRYFNINIVRKGNVGYKSGEKFAIKINLNGIWGADPKANINTSPQICHAILDQLVNVVKVAQSDIHIGDPSHIFDQELYSNLLDDFPNVKYYGYSDNGGYVENVFYSSDGKVVNDLPESYVDAKYMINIPVFKKHHRAGISVCSKNHFGSVVASMFHYSLPCPEATGVAENGEYGAYRCFVDIMGHKDLGGKTILYLVDALWGSTNYSHPPIKFRMSPFKNDYPSSLFLSQDPVAIESVCFDFLYEEFDENHPTEGSDADNQYEHGPYAHFPGTDDFLHQAADPANWPTGIKYDPENDGKILSSLGAHEHWNNPSDKKYSRNLGGDKGIELVYKSPFTSISEHQVSQNNSFKLEQNYPNPFTSTTCIKYELTKPSKVNLSVYDLNGKEVIILVDKKQVAGKYEQRWDGFLNNGSPVSPGTYLYSLKVENENGITRESKSLVRK